MAKRCRNNHVTIVPEHRGQGLTQFSLVVTAILRLGGGQVKVSWSLATGGPADVDAELQAEQVLPPNGRMEENFDNNRKLRQDQRLPGLAGQGQRLAPELRRKVNKAIHRSRIVNWRSSSLFLSVRPRA